MDWPNEVPAILQKGEEVLNRSDPRHRDNFRGGNVNVSITTPNAESLRRQAPGQIAAQISTELLHARNRNS